MLKITFTFLSGQIVEVEVASVNWMVRTHFLEYLSFDFIIREPIKCSTKQHPNIF